MPGTTNRFGKNDDGHELQQDLTAVGSTDAIKMARGDVVVQISGTGTATAIVERSTRDPNTANWAMAEDTPFQGDLAAGMSARTYTESGIAYWRVRLSAYTSGTVKVSIMGSKA